MSINLNPLTEQLARIRRDLSVTDTGYRFDFDRLSGTGIIVRLSDDATSLRYTGEDAERVRAMSSAELKAEAESQDFS